MAAPVLAGDELGSGVVQSKSSPLQPRVQMGEVGAAEEEGLCGILSELRLGVMEHDAGVFGSSVEDGVDFNAEMLFVSPDFLEFILSPRPHLGVSINSDGNTSQLYGGLTWDWTFWDPLFVELALGLSAHNGRLDTTTSDEKALGCRVLFRPSLSLGARFLERHSISVMLSHISNAGRCDPNKGLDTLGVRYGFRF